MNMLRNIIAKLGDKWHRWTYECGSWLKIIGLILGIAIIPVVLITIGYSVLSLIWAATKYLITHSHC